MKYIIYVPVLTSVRIEIEADSEEEALEQAEADFQPPSLCAHCSKQFSSEFEPELNEASIDEA